MSVLGDVVTIGGGGETASIWLTGAVQSTDIVTATKGSKTVNGVWTTISGVNGFLCDKIDEFGTWTVTASRSGTAYYTQNVLVDAAERYDLTYSSILYLYNEGDRCTAVTGGWRQETAGNFYGYPFTGTVTFNTDNIFISSSSTGTNIGLATTTNKVDLTGYSTLYFQYFDCVPSPDQYARTCFGCIADAVGVSSWQTHRFANTNSFSSGSGTEQSDVSNYQGEYFVTIASLAGRNAKAKISKVWLE